MPTAAFSTAARPAWALALLLALPSADAQPLPVAESKEALAQACALLGAEAESREGSSNTVKPPSRGGAQG